MRPLNVGIFLDIFDASATNSHGARAKRWDELRAFVQRVEALSFDSL